MSSATSITSGFAFCPSAISGRDPQAKAEYVTGLLHCAAAYGAGCMLQREIEACPITRQWCTEARRDRCLGHLVPIERKRESAHPDTRTKNYDATDQTWTGDFGADTGIPAIERLDSGGG